MLRFVRTEGFDAVISLFSSFVYCRTSPDSQLVLQNVFKSLKLGGIFLLDTISKEMLARGFQERGWQERDQALLLHERHVRNDWTYLENRMILIRDASREEFSYSHPIYSGSELRRMLYEAGFDPVDLYGDLGGGPFDNTAHRLVAVGRKSVGNSR